MFKKKDFHNILARWGDLFAEYRFQIIYRLGRVKQLADFIFRPKGSKGNVGDAGKHSAEVAIVETTGSVDLEFKFKSLVQISDGARD